MVPTKDALMELLYAADREVSEQHNLTIIGAGDTAMALHGLKSLTIHLDFVGADTDIVEFDIICANMSSRGFEIHTWKNGRVFGQTLPEDYLKASLSIDTKLIRIDLRALHPLDILLTKIERLNESDMRDIKTCIKHFRIGKNQILKRVRSLQQVGSQETFEKNLDIVLALLV